MPRSDSLLIVRNEIPFLHTTAKVHTPGVERLSRAGDGRDREEDGFQTSVGGGTQLAGGRKGER